MHNRWSPRLPDWHFNVPIISWGRRQLPRAAEAADSSGSASANKADGTEIKPRVSLKSEKQSGRGVVGTPVFSGKEATGRHRGRSARPR